MFREIRTFIHVSFIGKQIGHEHYTTYDGNVNPTYIFNDSTNATRELYWDEENRLMILSDNGKTSRYTYNHAGERIIKSHGNHNSKKHEIE